MAMNKPSALALAALMTALPVINAGAVSSLRPWIKGIVLSSDSRQAPSLQKFRVSFSPQPEKFADIPYHSGYAGDFADGKYRYMDYNVSGTGGISAVNFNILDLETGKAIVFSQTEALGVCMDMTYDVTTGKMYGISAVADALVEINPANGTASYVGPCEPLYTLSADAGGSLYGIGMDTSTGEAQLWTVNKFTGHCTLIGNTGVKLYNADGMTYMQTATFNHEDSTIWWCTTTESGTCELYEVDPVTAKAFRRGGFPDNEQFVGIFIEPSSADPAAPGPVSDVLLTPGQNGALTCGVSFKAPAVTAGGEALTQSLEVAVYRAKESEPLHTFNDANPGAPLGFTDTEVVNGVNAYRFEVWCTDLKSIPVYASAFCGCDYPVAVGNLAMTIDSDGSPELSWTAPAEGLNGGFIDPGALTYTISRNIEGRTETIASGLTATAYTDTGIDRKTPQYPYYYVTAVSQTGPGMQSDAVGGHVGPAYGLPFAESFADSTPTRQPWVLQSLEKGGIWTLGYINIFPGTGPYDGDYGMAMFDGFKSVTGAEARLCSPLFSLENTECPALVFHFYYYQLDDMRPGDKMTIDISTDGAGREYHPVPGAVFTQHDFNTGWTECVVPLKDYAGKPRVSVGFHGHVGEAWEGSGTGGFDLCLDNIRILPESDSGIRQIPIDRQIPSVTESGLPIYEPSGKEADGNSKGLLIQGRRKIIRR